MTPTAAGQLLVILLAPLLKGQHVVGQARADTATLPSYATFWRVVERYQNRDDVRRPTV